jgi:Ca2+-binding RTX toxin-like protein
VQFCTQGLFQLGTGRYHHRSSRVAIYTITGTGNSLFEAYADSRTSTSPRPLSDELIYQNATQFGWINADGSRSYAFGSGFVWDRATGQFTAGTISYISHYDANGAYVDDLTGLSGVTAAGLQAQLEASPTSGSGGLSALLLSGNDRLDATWFTGTNGVLLEGQAGNDRIRGSAYGDMLLGEYGNDNLTGAAGRDMIIGHAGGDLLRGGAGADTLFGDATDPRLGGGSDVLRGGDGNDRLDGGSQNDILAGGRGNDILIGSSGNDVLSGGLGFDTFIFAPLSEAPRPLILGWGQDMIRDFTVGTDHLAVSGVSIASLGWANDASGNAVLTADAANAITFIGIDANTVALTDLLA